MKKRKSVKKPKPVKNAVRFVAANGETYDVGPSGFRPASAERARRLRKSSS